ncbi:MAG: GH3 auxin-responsive promoter family protein, partial [Candidatus Omnitrophica bacterium]|nr:GH3 auxin-responsive promoter family protein [Candidatus Omnitrophota bacterium]
MSLLLKLLFQSIGPKTYDIFIGNCRESISVQDRLLNWLIKKNKECEYGKCYNFKSLSGYKDFQKRVPIVNYDDIYHYVESSLNGKKAQLTRDQPIFFATTSGTTGKVKYIPVTAESKSSKSQLLRVWFSKFFIDHPHILNGRVLSVISPEIDSYSPSGIPCGAESGHGYRNMPKATATSYSCPYDVFTIDDFETKYYVILRIALCQYITLIYSVNPSNVLLLTQKL